MVDVFRFILQNAAKLAALESTGPIDRCYSPFLGFGDLENFPHLLVDLLTCKCFTPSSPLPRTFMCPRSNSSTANQRPSMHNNNITVSTGACVQSFTRVALVPIAPTPAPAPRLRRHLFYLSANDCKCLMLFFSDGLESEKPLRLHVAPLAM